MPRDGSGRSHNPVEAGHDIQHGAPQDNEQPNSSGVDRSHKAAAPPAYEAGNAIGPSGQASLATGSGKGPEKSTVDEQAEKLFK